MDFYDNASQQRYHSGGASIGSGGGGGGYDMHEVGEGRQFQPQSQRSLGSMSLGGSTTSSGMGSFRKLFGGGGGNPPMDDRSYISTTSSRKRTNISLASGFGGGGGGGASVAPSVYSNPTTSKSAVLNTAIAERDDPILKLTNLLTTVTNTIFPHDTRIQAIAECLYEFDHRDKSQHDFELRYGAANVLFQKLAFAVNITHGRRSGVGGGGSSSLRGTTVNKMYSSSSSSRIESQSDHEIAMICTALEMVYRGSDVAIEHSFEEIGREVLPLIVKVIERAFDPYELSLRLMNGVAGIPKDKKIAVQKITKVLAAYSLVPSAKIPLAHERGMLAALVKVIDVTGFNRMLPESFSNLNPGLGANGVRESQSGTGLLMTEAARFNAIATITNLAFAEGNRMCMMIEPGLVLCISMVANSSQSEMARQCAALAIMNLSNGDDDNVPNMAGNEYLLDTLVKLMEDDRPETRRNAAVAIYNLANSDDNSALLARYGDGVILEVLIEIITSNDAVFWNDHARANAAETLFNMSCSNNPATTERMANHPGLLDSLATVLSYGNAFIDVMMYCAATLRRLAELIFPPMPCHGILLSSLVKASAWTKTDCIAQSFNLQAANPENRQIMVMHYGLLNALGNLALVDDGGEDCEKIHSAAIAAIEKLSNEAVTRPIMSKNEAVMMALTRASYNQRDEEEEDEDKDSLDDDDNVTTAELVKAALKNLVATL